MALIIGEPTFAKRLNNPQQNKEDTQEFLLKGTKPFNLPGFECPPNAYFMKSLKGNKIKNDKNIEFRLIIEHGGDLVTIYMTRLKEEAYVGYPKAGMMEVEVWRDFNFKYDDIVKGLPARCFKHLLSLYPIMISDAQMTSQGIAYWGGLISWAIDEGYYVYAADGAPDLDDEDEFDGGYIKHRIHTYQELNDKYESLLFGPNRDTHAHRHVIISCEAFE